jgi:transcriptional regulator with XRE-family HTH domain
MTPGRALLIRVLQRTRGRYVAARCQVTPAAVSRWVSGVYTPSARAKKHLAVNYGIPLDAWEIRRPSTRWTFRRRP